MNLDDLAWHAKGNGGLPKRTVDVLLEHGQLEVVIRAAVERGEWVCALAAVRELCAAGEFRRAEDVMAPFMEIGWQPAVWETARILVWAGRAEEGLALVPRGETEPLSAEDRRGLAELLAEVGRVDEAIDLLAPVLDEDGMAHCLVQVTEGQGRDERVLGLIRPGRPLRARVLERAGRLDEAIRVLRGSIIVRDTVMVGTLEDLAELLVRHGRMEELHEQVTGPYARHTVKHYVRALRERDREAEAEVLLREFIAAERYPEAYRWLLIELLVRQGRFGDAEEVARPTYGHFQNGLLESLVHTLVEAGQADVALRIVEELDAAKALDAESDWALTNRVWLLGQAGRYEEALAYAATLPPEEQPSTDLVVAGVLECLGRVDEAVELLRTGEGSSPWEAVEVLARHGRGAEGLAGMPSFADEREARRRRFGW
ncbi:tetratricopeptide repeat protein [Streptomyces zaomyceticus]|uniref:tetratricopeptide repeat protein n=1 Tax=Streptomyces zaomyceticus TaxID=68286 RepID=UPI0033A847CA